MSGFLEDWRVQVRDSIGEFAKIRLKDPELSISRGILPAALLWPILASIKKFEPAALEAVRELVGDQAPIILRAAQFLDDDPLSAARSLALATSQDPELASALEMLNTTLAPLDVVIDAMARAEVARRGAGDVNNISGQIKGWLVNIGGRVNIDNLSFNLPPVSWAERQERNLQLVLLKRVREIWINGVLEESLYHRVRLEIGLESMPEAVQQPAERILETPSGRQKTISRKENLLNIFGSSGYALLILGEPGSGKTTLLLELARDCLDGAESTPSLPIPTIFNLASWTPEKSFEDWLVEELLSLYQIPRRYSREWIRKDALMLLLDGLDEMRPEQRQACVATINSFRESHGVTYLTVSSRKTEYQSLNMQLRLGMAIVLQPIREDQIEAYLQEIGEAARGLRSALQADPALRELTHTPLLLNVMALAYSGESVDSISVNPEESLEARRRRLFNAYVEKTLSRRRAGARFSTEQIMMTLSWLATQMQRHSTSLFLMEQIQPSWLSPQWPRRLYQALQSQDKMLENMSKSVSATGWSSWVNTLLLGAVILSLSALVVSNPANWPFALILAVAGFAIWMLWSLSPMLLQTFLRSQVQAVETLRWSWQKATSLSSSPSFLDKLFSSKTIERIGWAGILSLILSLIRLCRLASVAPMIIVYFGLGIVALGVLVRFSLFMVRGLEYGQIRTRLVPNQGIWRSAGNGLLVMIVGGILAGIVAIVLSGLILLLITGGIGWGAAIWIGGSIGLFAGIILGMKAGGFSFTLHFLLRWYLQRQGIVPARLAELLDYASGQILLQKVGGGYMFIHRLLAEHFASLGVFRREPIMENPEDWESIAARASLDSLRTDLDDEEQKAMVQNMAKPFISLINFGTIDNEVVEALFLIAGPTRGYDAPALLYLGHLMTWNEAICAQVLAALNDSRPERRALATLALGAGEFSDVENLARVIDRLADENYDVRLAAISTLASYQSLSSEKIDIIIRDLRHPLPAIRAGVAIVLALMAERQPESMVTHIREELQTCIADSENEIKMDYFLWGRMFVNVKEVAEMALVLADQSPAIKSIEKGIQENPAAPVEKTSEQPILDTQTSIEIFSMPSLAANQEEHSKIPPLPVLNAGFALSSNHVIKLDKALSSNYFYDLLVDVGPMWKIAPSTVIGSENAYFPIEKLPTSQLGYQVRVVFMSEDFSPKLSTAEMWVSAETGRSYPFADGKRLDKHVPVKLRVRAPWLGLFGQHRRAQGRLCLYYKEQLIQSAMISVGITKFHSSKLEEPNKIEFEYVLTDDFEETKAIRD